MNQLFEHRDGPEQVERSVIHRAEHGSEVGSDPSPRLRNLGRREVHGIVPGDRQPGHHEAEDGSAPMIVEDAPHRVVAVEDVANGRLAPGERGADLLDTGFPGTPLPTETARRLDPFRLPTTDRSPPRPVFAKVAPAVGLRRRPAPG